MKYYPRTRESKTGNLIDTFRHSAEQKQIVTVIPPDEDNVLYEYQKIHRYIREHRIRHIHIRKNGCTLYLVKEDF